jgi:hypothetical protein
LDEFNFDESSGIFNFKYDLTFEFVYETCSIKIPTKYPKGIYEMKMQEDGEFIEYRESGKDFKETLKNIFDYFSETRMVKKFLFFLILQSGLESAIPQSTTGSGKGIQSFFSKNFFNFYSDPGEMFSMVKIFFILNFSSKLFKTSKFSKI